MTTEFKEEPLALGVYLRTEENRPIHSIRPKTCFTTFPLFGNLYLIHADKTLENPIEDLVIILETEKAPYEQFQKGVEFLQEAVDWDARCAENVVKEITTTAKRIFFKDQLARLTLVEGYLNEKMEENKRDHDRHWEINQHNYGPDYEVIYSAITDLHQAVLDAEYSFDKVMVGKGVKAEEKFGGEPYVDDPLERATAILGSLAGKDSRQNVSNKLDRWRKELLKDLQGSTHSSAERIYETLKNAKR